MNRQLTGVMADMHFSPTKQAKENLLAEGKDPGTIFVTGNTAIDALRTTVQKITTIQSWEILATIV